MKKFTTVSAYLAAVPKEKRVALTKLRAQIRAAAPSATESIAWGMPVFKHQGLLVGYAAFTDHCSLFPMSTRVMHLHAIELKKYAAGKGTVRFTADKPLPATLVKKLVKARLAENAAKTKKRK